MNMLLSRLPGASLCLLLAQKKIWLISAHPMSKKAHITSSGKSLILRCERSLNYMQLQLSVLLSSKHCQLLVYCLYSSLFHKLARTELGILIVMSFVCSTVVIPSRDSMGALDKFTHYFLQVLQKNVLNVCPRLQLLTEYQIHNLLIHFIGRLFLNYNF